MTTSSTDEPRKPSMPSATMWAVEDDGVFDHVYPSRIQVGMCTSEPPVQVTVTEVPAQTDRDDITSDLWWGWQEAGKTAFCMIWPTRASLQVCFPYGLDTAVARGQGRVVRLAITKTEPAP